CDVAGLLIVGLAFPVGVLRLDWLALPVAAALAVWLLCNALPRWLDRGKVLRPASRFTRRLSLLPYALAGAVSWYGVQQSGLSPALGLLPILPVIPHTDHAFGVFAEAETLLSDLLNRMARLLILPVAAVLFLFALTHLGAPLGEADALSLVVAMALLIGKPLGVIAGARIARGLRFALPPGVRMRHMPVIGLLAALGLTVPVFATETALPDGLLQDGARLGLIATLAVVPLLLALRGFRHGKQS
ncbi:Na+/H+ antiporter NhaA, partial [Thioclava sp. BHET1]